MSASAATRVEKHIGDPLTGEAPVDRDQLEEIFADAYGAEIIREAPVERLHASVRKALLIRIARAGALRLHDLEDPGAADGSV